MPTLARKVKKYLKANKINLNVQIADRNGNIIDSDIEDDIPDDPDFLEDEPGETEAEVMPGDEEGPDDSNFKERSLEAL